MKMWRAFSLTICVTTAFAALNATEDTTRLTLFNDRLFASVQKSSGAIDQLRLDGQDLLGTRSGNTGIGPYLDCYCTTTGNGAYTPGRIAPSYKLLQGTDVSNTSWGGIVLSETYPPTGQTLEQYWFLRDGETGLHTFSRLAYHNSTTHFLRNLQEFRTLFRPNTPLWTDLSSSEDTFAPLPLPNPAAGGRGSEVTVQDATWYLPNRSDPYVTQYSDYFTKYTFADIWRDHKVHGLFADGSNSPDGSTYGAWVVMNTVDTYFGGPKNSDLVVDGILYNYIISNHHGNGTPNITDGFDRTFGPQYHHFNKGPAGTTLKESREDALQYADPEWNMDFYDSIAIHVPNYVPTAGRGSWRGNIKLPRGAERPVAILAQNKVDFQDNVLDTNAYQYWADIDASTGAVDIPRVKAGTYRLTVFANGIFGQYTKDNIVVKAGKTASTKTEWKAESAGTELWRIGTPDRSSGEYRHGYARDPNHPLRPEEYRIYWAAYDYPTDFPDGVNFKVGRDDIATDLNYVHWSVFGGYANSVRTEPYYGNGDVNNWTIAFDTKKSDLQRKKKATFTVQLAGAKTAAGNTDNFNASEPYSNLPYNVAINGHALEPWIIPYNQSSSCAVRSAVSCYNLAHKFVFDAKRLKVGENEFVLSLPFNGTNYESALLPRSVYVQYDAMRLELG